MGSVEYSDWSFIRYVYMGDIYVAVRLIELTTSHLHVYVLIGSTNVCNLLSICRLPAAVSLW